jgi:hypothetical protein
VPPAPLADNSDAAVVKDCWALEETVELFLAVVVEALLEDPVELLVPLDAEVVDELEVPEEPEVLAELDDGLVGWKVSLLAAKPMFDA